MSDKSVIILCSALAFAALALSVTLAVLNRRNAKRIVRILGAGVFVMMVVMIFPSYHVQGQSYALGLALVQSMCAMLLNANAGEILAAFDAYSVGFIGVYKAVLLALLIIAPLFTVGITLSFFSEKFTRLIYRVRSTFRDSYLMSEINERTLCAAEDVASKNKKALIVFAVRENQDDIDAEALDRIKSIGAMVINDDVVNIKHSLKRERNYYLLGVDGSTNLDAGLRLYNKYNTKPTGNINMWLYTKEEVSSVIFDHLYETFNVRLINEEGLITRRLLTDYPLYNAIRDDKLSVLIVGAGNVGLEILRCATSYSQLGNVKVELNVIDIDGEKARLLFDKTCPGVAEKWNIRFHTADVTTASFTTTLKSIDPTYVVVALGNENRNIEAALYIRRIYGVKDGFPHIHVLVDHKRIEQQIVPNLYCTNWMFNEAKVNYERADVCSFEIKTFGSYEETYSDLRIGATYLDCLAMAHNATHWDITELNEHFTPALLKDLYNQVLFFKEYSDAFAVSVPYKLYLMGLELVDDNEGDLTMLGLRISDNVTLLREYENRRYEAYMRGNGWTDLPVSEVTGVQMGDKLTKRNARLNNDHMAELAAISGRDFITEDERSIYHLPAIIRIANELYGRSYSVRELPQPQQPTATPQAAPRTTGRSTH